VYAAVDKLARAMHELSRGHEEPVRGTCRLLLNLFAPVVRELSTAGAAQELLSTAGPQNLLELRSCSHESTAGAQKLLSTAGAQKLLSTVGAHELLSTAELRSCSQLLELRSCCL
jgi:hypothetical protein